MNGYYTNDGALKLNLVHKDFYYLDQVIKRNTNDKEFISFNEKLKTDLLIIYIESLLTYRVIIYFISLNYNYLF